MSNAWLEGRISEEEAQKLVGITGTITGWNTVVSPETVRHFQMGTGDDNPLYLDVEYATHSAVGRLTAPPCFLYSCCSVESFGPDELGMAGLFPNLQGFWLGDRWTWDRPLWSGIAESVAASVEITDVRLRPSRKYGKALVSTDVHTFVGADGSLIGKREREVMFVERSEAPVAEPQEAVYSEAEMLEIWEQYDREAGQRRGDTPRYFEDTLVGEELSPLVKGPLTLTSMISYAMGNGFDYCITNRIAHRYLQEHPGVRLFNPETNIEDTYAAHHWEPYFARRGGLPTNGHDFGSQRIAWMGHLVTDWCGDEGVLVGLDGQLRQPNLLGDTTWLTGAVVGKDESNGIVTCELTARNQRDQVTTTGLAKVRLPSRLSAA